MPKKQPATGPVVDHEHRDWPVCPHCGAKLCDTDCLPSSADEGTLDCDSCGRDCIWQRNVTVTYSTRLPDPHTRP